ncbi:sacsin N-terminal ATP-binding-like domain-containing protein [Archangium violaceum]|uniref:sacsin N-terminal ATP-binding-like domain-containing protein n=1 Tax=Archangium violaceum TaxID=83451 RepID=UPI0036DE8110
MTSAPQPRNFDQTSRITARLSDLVRSYPKGLGLVKEFLQNADDAGASYLHVTYDRRQHPGHLSNAEQDVVLGPALLFANDRPFTPDDLENIQHIDKGGKLREARGTGRFGQGFNSSYSVSDHPTLLTDDWVVWFDPHGRAHGRTHNAWAWYLKQVTEAWPAWAATFTPAGLEPGSERFNGTVFRLPLRSAKEAPRSEILQEAFTHDDFEAILDEVRRAGPALLVFLRSVQSLRIDELSGDGTRRLRYVLTTTNPAEVEAARAPLRELVRGDPRTLLAQWLDSPEPLPIASFIHALQVWDAGEQTACTWGVVTGLFRGPDNDLLRSAQAVCARNEKALPWAGAAVPLHADVKTGGLACFLPLPEPTPWPVLLQGWFDLHSSRRGITRQADTGESSQLRVQWNQKLMSHGVGPAWAMLVERLARDAGLEAEPYRLWPRPSEARGDIHDRALVEGFYAEIGARPVFRCVGPDGVVWRSLAGMGERYWSLEEAWHEQLRAPLLASGNTLMEPPLPAFAVAALQGAARVLSAEELRNVIKRRTPPGDVNWALSDAPHPALRRPEWVAALARFCSQGGKDKLAGLPLALLADGRLHTFGQCGSLFLVNGAERLLLAGVAHRLLEPRFQDEVGLTHPVAALGLKTLDLTGLVECLGTLLRAGLPGEQWWVQLFDHLEQLRPAEVKTHRAVLQRLPLIPDQTGQWRAMGSLQTPLLPSGISEPLYHALTQLGVPMVSGSEVLISSIGRFASRHQDFISTLKPEILINQLVLHARSPWLNQAAFSQRDVVNALLDFLSSPNGLTQNDGRVDALRRLPMLPTTDGAIVPAETPDLYVPGGFEPPYGIGVRLRLLEMGEDGRWSNLFRALRVPEQDGHAFVVGGLLPAFRDAPDAKRLQMLYWLRDHLHTIKADLAPEKRMSLSAEVRNAEILPLLGGGFGVPRHMYWPDAEEARGLLGGIAKVPDLERLGGDLKQWRGLFLELPLHSTPAADHLLQALRQCVAEASFQGVASVRERLSALREYIVGRWDSLGNPKKGGTQKFADELSTLPWLTAERPTTKKVAALANWPDRLYKANELTAPRLLHLVASVRPVLEGAMLTEEMARSLGLHTQVPLEEIFKHFAAVRAIDPRTAGDEEREACRKAFFAFVERLSQLTDTDSEMTPRTRKLVSSLQNQPCVLLRGMWWPARRVFLESLPFATHWCVSLLDDPELAGRPWAHLGLSRLGVRSRPESLDWVEMLTEQRERARARQLLDEELAQVHAVLQQLRVENREWLQAQPVSIPTAERQLLLARETLLPDDPRLKRLPCLCPLPLVEEIEVSLDMARRAGAHSLYSALTESLSVEPTPSQDTELLSWAEQRAHRVRSPAFHEALRRLAWHDAVERGEDPGVAANDEKLTLARRLTLRVVRDLHVTSRLRDTGQPVFEQHANSFWDKPSSILWLGQGGKRKLGDELARTLATECGLDALRLSRLLEVEPATMDGLLDEEGITVIPAGAQGVAAPPWSAPEPLFDVRAPADEARDGGGEDSAFEDEAPGADGPRPQDGQPWRGQPHGFSHGRGGNGVGPRPNPGQGEGTAPLDDEPSSTGASAEAPTTPGFGSSHPWSPDAPRSARSWTHRLRSYVHREAQNDDDTDSSETDRAQLIGRAAVQRVIDWERKRERTAVEVTDNRLGYDLDSSGSRESRLIEVKGIDGPWTARGVGVTRTEFRKALEAGSAWWLYVVEHALDPVRSVVHALPNPCLQVTEYRFDDGWRVLSVDGEPRREDPVEGEEIVLTDGRRATIVEVEPHGQLWKVTLAFPDGHEEVRPWDPAWKRG